MYTDDSRLSIINSQGELIHESMRRYSIKLFILSILGHSCTPATASILNYLIPSTNVLRYLRHSTKIFQWFFFKAFI